VGVQLWLAPLSVQASEADCQALLSPAERDELQTLEAPLRRREFMMSRALARRVLGRRLGLCPGDIQLAPNAQGKPLLVGPFKASEQPLHFNYSHSAGAVLLGLDTLAPMGVDIQAVEAPRHGVARRFLSATELARLQSLPALEQAAEFCRVWAVKEAILKAHGKGMFISPRFLEVTGGESGSSAGCQWWTVLVGDGHRAAAARVSEAGKNQVFLDAPSLSVITDWDDASA
jgi:4'-phosphopantetheinyl transferase